MNIDKWRNEAVCKDVKDGWKLFDLDEDNKVTREQKLEADTLCARCPVRRKCLQEALLEDTYGVMRAGVIFDGTYRHTLCANCNLVAARNGQYCGPCKVVLNGNA